MRALLGLLCALPLAASAQGFRFDGRSGSATLERPTAFAVTGADPSGTNFVEGPGRLSLQVEDRIGDPTARYGDKGSLSAEISMPTAKYRIEMDEAGFPRDAKLAPRQLAYGGVATDVPVHYGAPIGLPASVRAHAAFVLMGVGRVYRDDSLITDHALVYAFANSAGTHADDVTHAQLPEARPGDSEVEIFATGLPTDKVQEGFLRFFFDDVNISLHGVPVASSESIPTVPERNPEEVAPTYNAGMSGGATSGYGGSGGAGTNVSTAVQGAPPAAAPAYAGTVAVANQAPTIPQATSRTGPTPNPANGTLLQPVPLSAPSISSINTLDVAGGSVTRVDRFVNGQRVFSTGGTATTLAPGSSGGSGVVNNTSGTGGSGAANTSTNLAGATPLVLSPATNGTPGAATTPNNAAAVVNSVNANNAQVTSATTPGQTNVNGSGFINGSANPTPGSTTPTGATGQFTDINNGQGSAGGLSDNVRPENSNPAAPLTPGVRPANADPAAPLPPSPSALSANVLTPFPPTVRPVNSNAATPVNSTEPVNPNSPAPGVGINQFPGLTASSTNLPFAVTSTGTGSGIAGVTGTAGGNTPSASNVGTNNGTVPGFDSPSSSNTLAGTGTVLGGTSAQGTGLGTGIGGSGVATATTNTGMTSLLPPSGLDTGNIPGSNGSFAGLPVVGGAGTFPGLTPSSAVGVTGTTGTTVVTPTQSVNANTNLNPVPQATARMGVGGVPGR